MMRWTPTSAASMLVDESRGDKTKLLRDVGLYKVQGDAVTAVMGGIFQQFVSICAAYFSHFGIYAQSREPQSPTASSIRV
jgi:hypothetical protein